MIEFSYQKSRFYPKLSLQSIVGENQFLGENSEISSFIPISDSKYSVKLVSKNIIYICAVQVELWTKNGGLE